MFFCFRFIICVLKMSPISNILQNLLIAKSKPHINVGSLTFPLFTKVTSGLLGLCSLVVLSRQLVLEFFAKLKPTIETNPMQKVCQSNNLTCVKLTCTCTTYFKFDYFGLNAVLFSSF